MGQCQPRWKQQAGSVTVARCAECECYAEGIRCTEIRWSSSSLGQETYGGDFRPFQQLHGAMQLEVQTAVRYRIDWCTSRAWPHLGPLFAAVLSDGAVVTWGPCHFGGDSSRVQRELVGVQQVVASLAAFAALLSGGRVVAWGDPAYGGSCQDVSWSECCVSFMLLVFSIFGIY